MWLALYSVLPAVWGEYSPAEAWNNLRSVYINFIPSASHLWFVYMLLGIYLIMPIISPWLEKVSRREEELFLLLWLFTTLSWHFHYYVGDVFGECWWNPYPLLYYVSGYVGFVVLAHYIKTHLQWSVKTTLWVAIPLFLIGYAYCVWWFYTRSFVVSEVRELELTWQTTSIAPVLMSFALFMLIKLISRPCFAYKAARSISDMSYGMYLMHMLILPYVYDVLSGLCITPCAIMATAAVTYILSYIITRLISSLPGGKYIVG
ncbi:MAG: acyltransferase family protein [Coprobacter sp.]|nr:acyltransferase family protein [Coprobacter sp.]